MFTTLLFFNPLDDWMAYLSPNIQKNSEIAIKICKTWLLPAWLRKKKTHFEEKKALKNTFPQQKNTMMKKKHKKHFCFLKTLAGRTDILVKMAGHTDIIWNKYVATYINGWSQIFTGNFRTVPVQREGTTFCTINKWSILIVLHPLFHVKFNFVHKK